VTNDPAFAMATAAFMANSELFQEQHPPPAFRQVIRRGRTDSARADYHYVEQFRHAHLAG
jgi:hypothetical protein